MLSYDSAEHGPAFRRKTVAEAVQARPDPTRWLNAPLEAAFSFDASKRREGRAGGNQVARPRSLSCALGLLRRNICAAQGLVFAAELGLETGSRKKSRTAYSGFFIAMSRASWRPRAYAHRLI